ncbi:MAG: hypothetical protein J5I93_10270 [Pirellulaceae bacterium]|nr:hypothetical protein [Pirellulaceae bacterium]
MDKSPYTVFVAFAFFASVAVGQPLPEPNPDDQVPLAKPVATFTSHTSEVMALAFHSDGKQIVSVSTADVCSWQSDNGRQISNHKLAWSPQQHRQPVFALGPAGRDGSPVALVEYRAVRGRGFFADVVLFSPTGNRLVTFAAHDERQLDAPRRGGFSAYVATMAYTPDGKQLVTAGTSWLVGPGHGLHGGDVRIWDAETGKLIRLLGEVKRPEFRYPDGGVEKFIPPDAKVVPDLSTSTNAGALAVSADGKYVVVGTDGAGGELPEAGEIWIWDVASGKTIHMFTMRKIVPQGGWSSAVTAVALSHDNKHVAASVGGRPNRRDGLVLGPGPAAELRIWEVGSGRQVHTLRGHQGSVIRLAFSPDGKRLASAGSDQTVRLWDTGTGKTVITFPFDTPQINVLAFSPDGKLLAAGGGDGQKSGEVRVWACP